MKKFLLVYRADYKSMPKQSPEEMQATTQQWMNWFAGIAAQNKFVAGNHLDSTGKIVKSGSAISDGPYAEIKESIMGVTFIKAASFEEAAEMVKDCPILAVGGSVEIRPTVGNDFNGEDCKF